MRIGVLSHFMFVMFVNKLGYLPLKTFADRYKLLLEESSLTNYGVAKKSGLSQTTLHRFVNGEGSPTKSTLAKLQIAFPEFNMEWLVTGYGDIRSAVAHEETASNGINLSKIEDSNVSNSAIAAIPLVGFGERSNALNKYLESGNPGNNTFRTHGVKFGKFCAIQIDNNYMHPRLVMGTVVIGKFLDPSIWKLGLSKVVYVLEHADMGSILGLLIDFYLDKGVLELSTDLKKLNRLTIQIDDVRSLWKYHRHESCLQESDFGFFN